MNHFLTKLACAGALAVGMTVAMQTGAVAGAVDATAKAAIAGCVPGPQTERPDSCGLGTYPWINHP